MRFLEKINRFLNKFFMVIGGIAVLGMMALATMNVVLRIFKIPFSGAYEITGFLGAAVIAFALGYTQRRKDHIVVDIVSKKFPRRLAKVLDIFKFTIEMIFFGIVSWQIFLLGIKICREREVSETLKIIYYPFIFCVGIGFGSLSLNLLLDLLTTIFNHKEGENA